MTDTASKLPVKFETTSPARGAMLPAWQPLQNLRREVDRLFDDFDGGFWRAPFRRSLLEMQPFFGRAARWATEPVVDFVEKEKTFEIMAELPGMDEKNIEVKLANGELTIKGEKHEEKEEKKKDYYLHERNYGAFERCFALPNGVDPEKIEASFKKGILTVILPKKPETIKAEKKIEVKAEH